ncbi:unnamed protein product [Dovyalis caffra]|uniref:Uncharacterized protein n=1 Tax=Dovyalis caffra TaxID=77055 RepID=A0AAV1QSC5_9ROSI|nr:unnamed protein product [Dovyalis caffra]
MKAGLPRIGYTPCLPPFRSFACFPGSCVLFDAFFIGPHTSEHNEVAERNHCNIFETAQAHALYTSIKNRGDKVQYIVRFRDWRLTHSVTLALDVPKIKWVLSAVCSVSKIWKKEVFPRLYHPSVPLNPYFMATYLDMDSLMARDEMDWFLRAGSGDLERSCFGTPDGNGKREDGASYPLGYPDMG